MIIANVPQGRAEREAGRLVRIALLSWCAIVFAAGCAGEPAEAVVVETAEWFVTVDTARRGPYTESELRTEITSGRVRAEDLAWREGMPEWMSVSSILGSVLGLDAGDSVVSAYLDLCTRAAAMPGNDMVTIESYGSPGGSSESAFRAALARHAELIADVRNGIRDVGPLELDHARGEELLLPHLSPSRRLAKMLRADALMQIEQGEDAVAAADAAAIARLARQVAADRTLVSSLVSVAIAAVFADTASKLRSSVDADADLHEVADWLRGPDPFGFAPALETKRDFDDADDDPVLRTAYDELIVLVGARQRTSPAALSRFFAKLDARPGGHQAALKLEYASLTLRRAEEVFEQLAPVLTRFGS